MAISTQTFLDKVETAISNLLDAIDSDAVQEYSIGNRTFKRADFSKVLNELFKRRDILLRQVNRASNSPVRVAKLGRARTTDR